MGACSATWRSLQASPPSGALVLPEVLPGYRKSSRTPASLCWGSYFSIPGLYFCVFLSFRLNLTWVSRDNSSNQEFGVPGFFRGPILPFSWLCKYLCYSTSTSVCVIRVLSSGGFVFYLSGSSRCLAGSIACFGLDSFSSLHTCYLSKAFISQWRRVCEDRYCSELRKDWAM